MIAVVRIRGSANVPAKIRHVLSQLGLDRPNNVVLVEDSDTYAGMLQQVRHLVTYGKPSARVIEQLLRKRSEVAGYGRLTDNYVSEHTGHSSITDFSEALHAGSARLKELPMLKPTFRCSPPSKGWRNVKRSFQASGSLGNRGEAIDALLKRMM